MSFLIPTKGDADYVEGRDFSSFEQAPRAKPDQLNGRPFGKRVDGSPLAVEATQPELYRAVVRQLVHDGYVDAAEGVMRSTGVVVPDPLTNGNRLKDLLELGKASESIRNGYRGQLNAGSNVEDIVEESALYDQSMPSLVTSQMMVRHTTVVLAPLRCSSWSADGQFVACGATNGSIRLFSLPAFNEARSLNPTPSQKYGDSSSFETSWALARMMSDHSQSVEWVGFHPQNPGLLASGSRDGKLLMRNLTTPACTKVDLLPNGTTLQDAYPVRCAAFHPGGRFLMYGTDHDALRMLDVETGQFYSPGDVLGETRKHTAAIADVAVTKDGKQFASVGYDGALVLYDSTNGRPTWDHRSAHSSVPVTGVSFSRSDNIMLTAGMDGQARLWDMRKNNAEIAVFGTPSKTEHRMKAAFDATERAITILDSSLKTVRLYDIFSGKLVAGLEHMQQQRTIASNPAELLIAVGGDDSRLRLWSPAL